MSWKKALYARQTLPKRCIVFMLALLVVGGCLTSPTETPTPREVARDLLDAHGDVSSYTATVTERRDMTASSETQRLVYTSTATLDYHVDRVNRRLMMTGAIESQSDGGTSRTPVESYIVNDSVYALLFGQWVRAPAEESMWQENDVVAHIISVIGDSTPTTLAIENETYHLSFAVDPVFLFEGAIGSSGVRHAYPDADFSRLIRNSTFTVWVDPDTAYLTAVDVVVEARVTPEILGVGPATGGERADMTYRQHIAVSDINEPVSIAVPASAKNAVDYATASDALSFQGIGTAAPMQA